jgi:siroheme synthase-like protein
VSSYPIILSQLESARCLVVGGGRIAARKAVALIEAGARPVVVSPAFVPAIEALAREGQVTAVRRSFEMSDLDGATLVIAATDDARLHRSIAQACRERGILVNVVDAPELCTFTAPAVVRRGDLLVAIATGGRAPAYSRYIRQVLESTLGPEYGQLLSILADLRPVIHAKVPSDQQGAAWNALLDGRLLRGVRSDGLAAGRDLALSILQDFVESSHDMPIEWSTA